MTLTRPMRGSFGTKKGDPHRNNFTRVQTDRNAPAFCKEGDQHLGKRPPYTGIKIGEVSSLMDSRRRC